MDQIDKAFKFTPRDNFLPDNYTGMVEVDMPLPIGYGQTNSQPSTVRMMLEWLEVEPGNKILDVGSGSGWTTALLANLTGPKGMVYAVEIVPELVRFGRANVERLDIKNARFYRAGKTFGLPDKAPFDRILVSAAAQKLPTELLDQLRVGGKMVIPVRSDVLEIEKTSDKTYETHRHPGFAFVPLIEKS